MFLRYDADQWHNHNFLLLIHVSSIPSYGPTQSTYQCRDWIQQQSERPLLVRKCTSASGTCFLRQRITGVVNTISPIDEKRTSRNFILFIQISANIKQPDWIFLQVEKLVDNQARSNTMPLFHGKKGNDTLSLFHYFDINNQKFNIWTYVAFSFTTTPVFCLNFPILSTTLQTFGIWSWKIVRFS